MIVGGHELFGGMCYLHLQSERIVLMGTDVTVQTIGLVIRNMTNKNHKI
jgi:hypothetical protein